MLNTKGLPPEACESALVPKVGPRDFWGSDMIHRRQSEEVAEIGLRGETQAVEGIEPQSPEAKINHSNHLAWVFQCTARLVS